MKKVTLNNFPDEFLDYMEELLLVMDKEEIKALIAEQKVKREEEKKINWNTKIPVEDMGLEWSTVIKLKRQNINTLYDVIKLGIDKIEGLYPTEKERIDWAILFFDMTKLQEKHKKNPNMSQMDVAKEIIKQGEATQKVMKRKYGHEV